MENHKTLGFFVEKKNHSISLGTIFLHKTHLTRVDWSYLEKVECAEIKVLFQSYMMHCKDLFVRNLELLGSFQMWNF